MEYTTMSVRYLDEVPDFSSWEKAALWIEEGLKDAESYSAQTLENAQIGSLSWSGTAADSRFGLYASKEWQKFVMAAYLADLLSYPSPPDQVTFDRLAFVMHSFPEGFRVWFIKQQDGPWRPIGYTGWYPMLESAYEIFSHNPEKLTSRMVVPTRGSKPYIYLFNCSVVAPFKKQPLTKALMTHLADDIQREDPEGLACITVSEDGIRVATRFDMTRTGSIGDEGVFVRVPAD